MKNVRIESSEKEKLSQSSFGLNGNMYALNEQDINSIIQKEKANKFNTEVDKFTEQIENSKTQVDNIKESISYDINKAEIKPMFSRLLIKPFVANPFQNITVDSGIITDIGGLNPHIQFNERTGKYEEQKQFIVTGSVVEVGPEVKYLKEGDVIFYRVDTAVPVPFFKQGFVSLAENQVIAVVNEQLQNRFDNIKQ